MGAQQDENVQTGVDVLIEFLRGKGQVALKDIAKRTNLPEDVMQTWVDFLVEEKVIGLEYKLTSPYVYLIKDPKGKQEKQPTEYERNLQGYRKEFEEHARTQKISGEKTNFLWKNQVGKEVEAQKAFFYEEANRRKLPAADTLWAEYKTRIIGVQ